MVVWILRFLSMGLAAEREQGITIDVAYRYFTTTRRHFIVADTPGHEQYTRNMATGASTAALAIIMIDARKGVLDQTRRHAFIASLLGIRHVVLAINKMDLVGYAKGRSDDILAEFLALNDRLSFSDIKAIPFISSSWRQYHSKSDNMLWYDGPTLLDHLETVEIGSSETVPPSALAGSVCGPPQPGFPRLCGADCDR